MRANDAATDIADQHKKHANRTRSRTAYDSFRFEEMQSRKYLGHKLLFTRKAFIEDVKEEWENIEKNVVRLRKYEAIAQEYNYKLKSEQADRRLQLVAPKPLHVPTPTPGVVDFSGALDVTNTGEVFRNVVSLQKRAATEVEKPLPITEAVLEKFLTRTIVDGKHQGHTFDDVEADFKRLHNNPGQYKKGHGVSFPRPPQADHTRRWSNTTSDDKD